MSQKYVFFTRHGETPSVHLRRLQSQTIDEPLNKTGREQAKNLGKRLKKENIGLILTSTAKRAIETSIIVAATIALYPDSPSVIAEADFLEINCGSLDGLLYEEIKLKHPDLYNAWWGDALHPEDKHKFPFLNGEGFSQAMERGDRAVARIKRACEVHQGNILVVGHGSMNIIIVSQFLGLDSEVFFDTLYFENCGLIKIDTDHFGSDHARWIID